MVIMKNLIFILIFSFGNLGCRIEAEKKNGPNSNYAIINNLVHDKIKMRHLQLSIRAYVMEFNRFPHDLGELFDKDYSTSNPKSYISSFSDTPEPKNGNDVRNGLCDFVYLGTNIEWDKDIGVKKTTTPFPILLTNINNYPKGLVLVGFIDKSTDVFNSLQENVLTQLKKFYPKIVDEYIAHFDKPDMDWSVQLPQAIQKDNKLTDKLFIGVVVDKIIRDRNKIKGLIWAIQTYSQIYKKLPDNLGLLSDKQFCGNHRLFLSSFSNTQEPKNGNDVRNGLCDFLYFGKKVKYNGAATFEKGANIPLMVAKIKYYPKHIIVVGFLDGHVESFTELPKNLLDTIKKQYPALIDKYLNHFSCRECSGPASLGRWSQRPPPKNASDKK